MAMRAVSAQFFFFLMVEPFLSPVLSKCAAVGEEPTAQRKWLTSTRAEVASPLVLNVRDYDWPIPILIPRA